MDIGSADNGALESGYVVRAGTKGDYAGLQTVFEQAEAFHREALPEVFRKTETTFPPRPLYPSHLDRFMRS